MMLLFLIQVLLFELIHPSSCFPLIPNRGKDLQQHWQQQEYYRCSRSSSHRSFRHASNLRLPSMQMLVEDVLFQRQSRSLWKRNKRYGHHITRIAIRPTSSWSSLSSSKNDDSMKEQTRNEQTISPPLKEQEGESNKKYQQQLNAVSSSISSGSTTKLAVFPLRKRVKFPTETVQLTLWEERYKYLAQSVLNQVSPQSLSTSPLKQNEYHSFGILYASHKPQIIRNGDQPITPMINVGDMGVLCVVKEYTLFSNDDDGDGGPLTPTRTENGGRKKVNFPKIGTTATNNDERIVNDIHEWKKIQLIGLGVKRFRVEKIVSRGFDGHGYDPNSSQNINNNRASSSNISPFIIVEASVIDDDDDFISPSMGRTEVGKDILDLKKSILQRDQKSGDDLALYKKIEMDYNMYPHLYKPDQVSKDSFHMSKAYDELKIIQLWSFALMSKLEINCPANEMLNMLSITSLKERLKYINMARQY